jgi:hypothetical protein
MKEAEMREACFCGWAGDIAEREPTYLGDGDWGLACPSCGHLDRLAMWPTDTWKQLVAEARRRREAPVDFGMGHTDEPAA